MQRLFGRGGDSASSSTFFSIQDEATWAQQLIKHSKKLREMPLYKFDNLGFYRPLDDPSAHLVTFHGTAMSSVKLEKLHAQFAKAYQKANEIINEIYEREIELHNGLDWLVPGSSAVVGQTVVVSSSADPEVDEL